MTNQSITKRMGEIIALPVVLIGITFIALAVVIGGKEFTIDVINKL